MARKHLQNASSGSRILVVDDSQEILESTRRLLEKEGHTVLTAASGMAALEILENESVHLMVVDYFMPAMTGEELVRRVRQTGDHLTQIILATGYSGEKPARVMMQQLDIQGYHDKGEGAQKLLLWVDTALKAHRHMLAMEKHRKGLRFILDLTPELHRMQPVDELLEVLLWQLEALLGAENSFVATLPAPSAEPPEIRTAESACFIALADSLDHVHDLQIRVGTGRFSAGQGVGALPDSLSALICTALEMRAPHTEDDCSIVPLILGENPIGVIYLDRRTGYAKDREILEIFALQAAAAIQNALLYDMATIDPLTGTYLRGFADQQLEHAVKRSYRRSSPLSLMMIDLDRLKEVNDLLGHQAGDKVLSATGDLLRIGIRETDLVGRYGGDEFMVILPDTGAAGALIVANRLLERSAHLFLEIDGYQIPMRLSLGIGTLIPEESGEERLLGKEEVARAAERLTASADRALYAAKGSGTAGERPALSWSDVLATPAAS